MTSDKRAKLIEKQILRIWDSLQSHLYYTHNPSKEGRRFHRKCVKDYAKQLEEETKLY